jgi:ATP-dependent DNA helicase MPH1
MSQLQRVGRTGRKRDGKVHVLMSEGREDTNWESAQQTHREIQEEILHSRNLELFEDVEPLLIPGQFPKCVEQEMPVDPWDPADQKMKTRLLGSQEVKATKKSRGHEIPDDAIDGFMSVADLLKGKGKGKKRARSPTPVRSDGDDDNDEHDDEAEHALLYGTVKSTTAKTLTKAQAKGRSKGLAKKAEAVEKKAAANKKAKVSVPKETKEEKKKRLESEETTKMAIDFFNTYGPIRRREPSPPRTPPSSSPSEVERPARIKPRRAGHPPSPISDESLTKAGPSTTISPGTAALAGLSQLDAIDFSWDNDDLDDDIQEIPAGPSRPQKPSLVQSRSTAMMPPPPLPASRASASPANKAADSPFNIRPGGQRRPVHPPGDSSVAQLVAPFSESPARPATRDGAVDDSSPLVPQPRRPRQPRERRRPRVDKETVRNLVSPLNFESIMTDAKSSSILMLEYRAQSNLQMNHQERNQNPIEDSPTTSSPPKLLLGTINVQSMQLDSPLKRPMPASTSVLPESLMPERKLSSPKRESLCC